MVVHLPNRRQLQAHHNSTTPAYAWLLSYIEDHYRYIATEALLGDNFIGSEYWGATDHYGTEINRVIGDAIAEEIASCIDSDACVPPRFAGSKSAFLIAEASAD